MKHICDGLYQMQDEWLAEREIGVPCAFCLKLTPYDKVTWVAGRWENKPYCDKHLEEALTKGCWQ